MRLRAAAKWTGLALLGLAVAIGVAIAATNLTSQKIGISSEPVTAGDSLAPQAKPAPRHRQRGESGREKRREQEPTQPTETTVPEETLPPSETTQVEPTPPPTTEEGSGGEPEDHGGGGEGGGGDD